MTIPPAGVPSRELEWKASVTADGRFLIASDRENGSVLGDSRGRRELRRRDLVRVPAPSGEGPLRGPDVLRAERGRERPSLLPRVHRGSPGADGRFPAFQIAPPLPFIPEDRHGDTFIAMVAFWAGPLDQGEEALRPFHDVAPVVAEFVGPMRTRRSTARSTAWFPPAFSTTGRPASSTSSPTGQSRPMRPTDRTCPPSTPRCTSIQSTGRRTAWRRTRRHSRIGTRTSNGCAYYDAIAPHSEEGGYVNFMADDDQGRIKADYKGNHERLVDIKRT
jgi:hypothetical protein